MIDKELNDMIDSLSPELKESVYLFVENIKLIREMVKGKKMPPDVLEKAIHDASEKGDHLGALILLAKQQYDEEQEN